MDNLKQLEGKKVRVYEATYNHSSFAAPICMTGECTFIDLKEGWIVLDGDKIFNLKFLNRIEIVVEKKTKKIKKTKKEKAEEKKARKAVKANQKQAKRDIKKVYGLSFGLDKKNNVETIIKDYGVDKDLGRVEKINSSDEDEEIVVEEDE